MEGECSLPPEAAAVVRSPAGALIKHSQSGYSAAVARLVGDEEVTSAILVSPTICGVGVDRHTRASQVRVADAIPAPRSKFYGREARGVEALPCHGSY